MPTYKDTLLAARNEFRDRFIVAYREIIAFQIKEFTRLGLQHLPKRSAATMLVEAEDVSLPAIEFRARRALAEVVDEYGSVAAFNAMSILEIQQNPNMEFNGIIGTALRTESNIARNLALRDLRDALIFGGEDFAFSEFKSVMDTWSEFSDNRGARAVVQVDGDIARTVWKAQGVTKLIWNIAGDTCDACTGLSGQVVGLEGGGAFLSQGQNTQEGQGEDQNKTQGKIWAGSDVLHPPLHGGCDCYITPVSGFRSEGNMETEKRVAGEIGVEKRDGEDADKLFVSGYAAVFDTRTELWKGRFEQIAPGAFEETIKNGADIRMNFNHDPNQVLARTTNGTLKLWEDKHGLAYRAELNPKDSQAVSIFEKIDRRDVSQSSFMFDIPDGGETVSDIDGGRLYTLLRVNLHDVGPVTYPAYLSATVSARTRQRRCAQPEALSIKEQFDLQSPRASPGVVATRIRQRTDHLKQTQLKTKGDI